MKKFFSLLLITGSLVACKPLVDTMTDTPSEDMGTTMKDEETMQGDIVGSYRHYQDGVLRDRKKKVLFFHASWCPVCKQADGDLRKWYGEEQVPLPTYRIDYDSSDELKKNYGVTMQHTFVLVDGTGKELAKLTGPSGAELKRLLYGNLEEAKAMDDSMGMMVPGSENMGDDMQVMEDDVADKMSGEFTAYRDGVIGNGEYSVLFFHAKWCPYCIANEKRLNDWYDGEDIARSVYKIDFDTQADLKTQFGVTQQDTFILIDGKGKEVKRVSFPSEEALRGLLQ